jgi:hypothetical protein
VLGPDPRAFDEGPIGQYLIQIELGLRPWPSMDAKRHHFISRFLLNRFAPASERLFQLDIRTGKPQGGIPTGKAASRMRFYEFEDEEGNKSNVVEGLFAIVEDAATLAPLRRVSLCTGGSPVGHPSFLAFPPTLPFSGDAAGAFGSIKGLWKRPN